MYSSWIRDGSFYHHRDITHLQLSHTLRSYASHLVEIERAVFGLEDDHIVQINLEVNVLMRLVRKRRAKVFSD
jgi:hypothetical protein